MSRHSVDTQREDPLLSFHFGVKIEPWVSEGSYFTEVAGLGSETEIVEHKVVNSQGVEVVLKIPARLKWENITLKRGITSNMDIWKWRQEVEEGKVNGARANASVYMYNQQGDVVAEWAFLNAWPVKVTGPSIKADSNEIGIEELTIAHEGISRVQLTEKGSN